MANKINKLSLRKGNAGNASPQPMVAAKAEGDITGLICYIYDALTGNDEFETIVVNRCETDKGDACLTNGWGNCDDDTWKTVWYCTPHSFDAACPPQTEYPCPVQTVDPHGCETDPDYTDFCELTKQEGYGCWKSMDTCRKTDKAGDCMTGGIDEEEVSCWCMTYGETCQMCTQAEGCVTNACTRAAGCNTVLETCKGETCNGGCGTQNCPTPTQLACNTVILCPTKNVATCNAACNITKTCIIC